MGVRYLNYSLFRVESGLRVHHWYDVSSDHCHRKMSSR